ncbi:MAG: glycosyltransferase family 87 protein [Candidatus Obscuribacterales bacterium]
MRRIKTVYFSLLLSAFVAISIGMGGELGKINSGKNTYADFVMFYRMAKMAASPSDRFRIYDKELQKSYFNQLNASVKTEQAVFSQNPPFTFLLVAPFALLPIEPAFRAWILLSCLAGIASIAGFMRLCTNASAPEILSIFFGTYISFSGFLCLAVGQTSWFMLSFILIFLYGLLKRNDAVSGLGLALTTCKFQYFPILMVPLIAQKRWKSLAWFSAIMGTLLCISAFYFGPQNVIGYPSMLFDAETTKAYDGVFPEFMISLRGLLSNLMPRGLALKVSGALMLVFLIPLYYAWVKHKPGETSSTRSSFCLASITVLCALILSTHTHIYDEIFLAAATCCWLITERNDTTPNKQVIQVAFATIIWLYPFSSWAICLIGMAYGGTLQRLPILIMNVILLLLAYLRLREITKDNPS